MHSALSVALQTAYRKAETIQHQSRNTSQGSEGKTVFSSHKTRCRVGAARPACVGRVSDRGLLLAAAVRRSES